MSRADPTNVLPYSSRAAPRAWLGVTVILAGVYAAGAYPFCFRPTAETLEPGVACLQLDPNYASVDELKLLPGIGPGLSGRIVSYREQSESSPAFRSAEDLAEVRGFGPTRIANLRPHLCFDALPTPHAESLP